MCAVGFRSADASRAPRSSVEPSWACLWVDVCMHGRTWSWPKRRARRKRWIGARESCPEVALRPALWHSAGKRRACQGGQSPLPARGCLACHGLVRAAGTHSPTASHVLDRPLLSHPPLFFDLQPASRRSPALRADFGKEIRLAWVDVCLTVWFVLCDGGKGGAREAGQGILHAGDDAREQLCKCARRGKRRRSTAAPQHRVARMRPHIATARHQPEIEDERETRTRRGTRNGLADAERKAQKRQGGGDGWELLQCELAAFDARP